MRFALIEPDIPHNVGAAIRLSACFDAALDVVEPCGFPLTDKAVRRAAMDYGAAAEVRRHASLAAFLEGLAPRARLILFTTRADAAVWDFAFAEDDVLAFGAESRGAPERAHDAAHARLVIPLAAGARSLNVAVAAGVALGEAARQRRLRHPG